MLSPSLGLAEPQANCKLNIVFEDYRHRETTFGKTLPSKEAKRWLKKSVYQSAPKLTTENKQTPPIFLALEQSYISHIATTKSGVVLISAQQTGKKHYYRGRDTSVNWWGTETEFQDAIQNAMMAALQKFYDDKYLKLNCET